MTAAFVVLIAGMLASQAPAGPAAEPEVALENTGEAFGEGGPDEDFDSAIDAGVPTAGPVEFPVSPPGPRPMPEALRRAPSGESSPTRALPAGTDLAWREAFAPATWSIWALVAVGLAAMMASLRMVGLLRRQMRALSAPRLHVDGIRFTGLVAGTRPVFFVRVGNAGPTDALKVTVTIGAVYQGGGGKAGAPQTMTIPAHGNREFFVRWQNALTSAVRDDIQCGSSKLCVKVTVQHGEGDPEKHCYQYHPWDLDRPAGVPDFVSCDLDSQLGGFATGRMARVATEDIVVPPQIPLQRKPEPTPAEMVLD